MGKEATWAGGSYGGTLSPVTTEAGEGYKIVRSGGTLHGWDKYVQLVAEHYASLPSYASEERSLLLLLRGISLRCSKGKIVRLMLSLLTTTLTQVLRK
jgi:hypothetical protein